MALIKSVPCSLPALIWGWFDSGHNGICVSESFADDLKQQGIVFGSLDSLVTEHSDLLESTLLRAAFDREDRFALCMLRAGQAGNSCLFPVNCSCRTALSCAFVFVRWRCRFRTHHCCSGRWGECDSISRNYQ